MSERREKGPELRGIRELPEATIEDEVFSLGYATGEGYAVSLILEDAFSELDSQADSGEVIVAFAPSRQANELFQALDRMGALPPEGERGLSIAGGFTAVLIPEEWLLKALRKECRVEVPAVMQGAVGRDEMASHGLTRVLYVSDHGIPLMLGVPKGEKSCTGMVCLLDRPRTLLKKSELPRLMRGTFGNGEDTTH